MTDYAVSTIITPGRSITLAAWALVALFAGTNKVMAQIPTTSNIVNGATSVPIPGVGHNYIRLLSETVDPSSGSVNIRISFPVTPSRGITLPFSLSYSTAGVFLAQYLGTNVELLPSCPYGTAQGTDPAAFTKCGWRYTFPESVFQYTSVTKIGTDGVNEGTYDTWTSYTFTDPSGVSHTFPFGYQCREDSGTACPAVNEPSTMWTDGDLYLQFTPPVTYESLGYYKIYDSAGTIYTFPQGDPSLISTLPAEIEDRNGNTIYPTVTSSGGNNPIVTTTFPDTAGRTAFSVSGNEEPGSYDTVTAGGLTYKVYWGTTTASYSMPAQSVEPSGSTEDGCAQGTFSLATNTTGYTMTVVSSIVLPNTTSYVFTYGDDNSDPSLQNPYGLLNEIIYPDGGWVKYTYKPSNTYSLGGQFPSFQVSGSGLTEVTPNACQYEYSTPVLATRSVSYDGVHVAEVQNFTNYSTTFSTENGSFYEWTSKTTSVNTTDEIANRNFLKTYTYVPVPGVVPNYTYDRIAPQIPVENQVSTYDWGNTTTPLNVDTKYWLNPFSMTEEDLTVGALTSRVVYTPGSHFPQEVDEYNYGASAPTRKTMITYQPISSPGVIMIPCKTVITDGNGDTASEVDNYFDGNASLCGAITEAGTTSDVKSLPANSHDETLFGPSESTPRGNLTKQVYVLSTGASPTTTFAYDETGQMISMTEPCGNSQCGDVSGPSQQTTYSYADSPSGGNAAGNSNAYVTLVTNPLGQTQNYTYNYVTGNLLSDEDSNQNTIHYTYNDPLNRLRNISFPDGGNTGIVYTDGGPNPTITTTTQQVQGGNAQIRVSVFDGLEHLIQAQLTSDPGGPEYVDISYNGNGGVNQQSNPTRCSSAPGAMPSSCSESTYGITTYSYDVLGRKTIQTQPDGSTLQWCYDDTASTGQNNCSAHIGSISGTWVDFTDESGKHWQRTSDALGRLTEVIEDVGHSNLETDYAYDTLDNLTHVDQWGGANGGSGDHIRTFAYDGLSRLICASNPEDSSAQCPAQASSYTTGTTGYSYDADGNVISKTSPKPNSSSGTITTSYAYDALNRLLSKRSNDGVATPAACYQYDTTSLSPPAGQSGNYIGRLTNEWTQSVGANNSTCAAAIPPSGTTLLTSKSILSYDSMGRILSQQTCVYPNCTTTTPEYPLAYNYDLVGHITSYTNGNDSILLMNYYDGAGRLSKVTSSWSDPTHPGTLFSSPTYDPAGQLTAATYGTGLTLTRSYDNRLRITGETDHGGIVQTATPGTASIVITGTEQTQ